MKIKRYSSLINLIYRIADILIVFLCTYLLAYLNCPSDFQRLLYLYGGVLVLVVFPFLNVYQSWRMSSFGEQLKAVALAWLLVMVVFNLMILAMSNAEQFTTLWPWGLFKSSFFRIWAILNLLVFIMSRVLIKRCLNLFRSRGYNRKSAVIIGRSEGGLLLASYLQTNPWMGVQLKGFFAASTEANQVDNSADKVILLGNLDQCASYTKAHQIDIAFIALPLDQQKNMNNLFWELGTKGTKVYLVADLFALGIHKANVKALGELVLMDYNLFPIWKRVFDLIFSTTMVLLTLPIWILIMFLVKLEDRGPIFFKHPRIMENGKSFFCWKFRTMYEGAENNLNLLLDENPEFRDQWQKHYKLKNDPRVTRIGKILRRTSLDELPQFINVILGEMSVVGARPIVPEELEVFYKKIALTYCAMKPGITGPWQVGARSGTEDYAERVNFDHWYAMNCTFYLDIKIILKTILRIIFPKGA